MNVKLYGPGIMDALTRALAAQKMKKPYIYYLLAQYQTTQTYNQHHLKNAIPL